MKHFCPHIFSSLGTPLHPILSNTDVESAPSPSKDVGGTDVLMNIE